MNGYCLASLHILVGNRLNMLSVKFSINILQLCRYSKLINVFQLGIIFPANLQRFFFFNIFVLVAFNKHHFQQAQDCCVFQFKYHQKYKTKYMMLS